MQLETPEEDLRAFALQEDLAGGGEDVVGFVDMLAVDKDRDAIAGANAFDPSPLAERAFYVVTASKPGTSCHAVFLCSQAIAPLVRVCSAAVWIELVFRIIASSHDARRRGRCADGHVAAVGVSAMDQQQVAETAFHHLALDGRLVGAAADVGARVAV